MKWVDHYAKAVSNHPFIVLVLVVIITLAANQASQNVGTKSMDNKDMIPDTYPVINAFGVIEDTFGGSDSVMIAVETSRDIRDPEIIQYIYTLTKLSERVDDVQSATSVGTILTQMNNDTVPSDRYVIRDLIEENPILTRYISDDFGMAIIRISLEDQYDANDIAVDLQTLIGDLPIPNGLEVAPAGEIVMDPIIEQEIGPDMQRTSQFSMIGIIIVLFLLFFSIRYALTPLVVIVLGIAWAFGYFGLVGINLSPQTSGAISMIMGIGIDFGIQIIARFRQELRNFKPKEAMRITMNQVFIPMSTTTIAALIGFKAMSMGELSVLQELATIMGYGVFFCFLAAITVVPAVAVLGDEINTKVKLWFNKTIKVKS
ncbi:MMPL family transporter [Candidatus Woesearchaeota archaeon]|nr:MMPL family transporter [Candidatus Woesearchaeota archaeon]